MLLTFHSDVFQNRFVKGKPLWPKVKGITDTKRNLLLQKELRDEHERHTEDELSKQSEYIDAFVTQFKISILMLRKCYSHICI